MCSMSKMASTMMHNCNVHYIKNDVFNVDHDIQNDVSNVYHDIQNVTNVCYKIPDNVCNMYNIQNDVSDAHMTSRRYLMYITFRMMCLVCIMTSRGMCLMCIMTSTILKTTNEELVRNR